MVIIALLWNLHEPREGIIAPDRLGIIAGALVQEKAVGGNGSLEASPGEEARSSS
jgi:hypothetical protein